MLEGRGHAYELNRERWLREEAEPWWQAMRERAERDGVRIDCFQITDTLYEMVGIEPLVPAARLLSPSGVPYPLLNYSFTPRAREQAAASVRLARARRARAQRFSGTGKTQDDTTARRDVGCRHEDTAGDRT